MADFSFTPAPGKKQVRTGTGVDRGGGYGLYTYVDDPDYKPTPDAAAADILPPAPAAPVYTAGAVSSTYPAGGSAAIDILGDSARRARRRDENRQLLG